MAPWEFQRKKSPLKMSSQLKMIKYIKKPSPHKSQKMQLMKEFKP